MPEPMARAYGVQYEGRIFRRSRLRDRLGPDDPIFHLLEQLCINDVINIEDDFTTSLDTARWTAAAIAGGVAYVRTANTLGGIIAGSGTTTSGDGGTLFTTNNEVFVTNARPVGLIRHRVSAITTVKLEFGFADAVQSGQVNVKATPTSTGTDYAVIIYDTVDDTNTELVVDGTTPAVAKVDASAAITALAANTYQTWMLALNEQNASYYWVNGVFGGVQRANGPDDDVTLGIFACVRTRADATARTHDIDYIKAVCDRVVF